MSWNVQGSMRGDGVPAAPGMLDSEAVAAGVLKAEGAILDLFQETGLQDRRGMVHMENQWRHHGYHAFLGVDAQAASAAAVCGGLLIALRADVFAAEEVRDVVDIVPGKAMALDVVTVGGTLTVINVHGPGSGDPSAPMGTFGDPLAPMGTYGGLSRPMGTYGVGGINFLHTHLDTPPLPPSIRSIWDISHILLYTLQKQHATSDIRLYTQSCHGPVKMDSASHR